MKRRLQNKNTAFIPPRPAGLTTVCGGCLGCAVYVEQIADSHSPNLTMPGLEIEAGIKREEAVWITMGKMAAQTLNLRGGVSA